MKAKHTIHAADAVRTMDNIQTPDPRNALWSRLKPSSEVGGKAFSKSLQLEDFIEDIKDCVLSDAAPEKAAVQLETAKNLYIYSWYCYRFGLVRMGSHLTSSQFFLQRLLRMVGSMRKGLKSLRGELSDTSASVRGALQCLRLWDAPMKSLSRLMMWS